LDLLLVVLNSLLSDQYYDFPLLKTYQHGGAHRLNAQDPLRYGHESLHVGDDDQWSFDSNHDYDHDFHAYVVHELVHL